MFEVKDRKSTEIQDFDVFIDEKQVALKDDKQTTKNTYDFNAKLNLSRERFFYRQTSILNTKKGLQRQTLGLTGKRMTLTDTNVS